jgi:hypothetical protein
MPLITERNWKLFATKSSYRPYVDHMLQATESLVILQRRENVMRIKYVVLLDLVASAISSLYTQRNIRMQVDIFRFQ